MMKFIQSVTLFAGLFGITFCLGAMTGYNNGLKQNHAQEPSSVRSEIKHYSAGNLIGHWETDDQQIGRCGRGLDIYYFTDITGKKVELKGGEVTIVSDFSLKSIPVVR
jgi:hypothetical protein